MPTNYTGNPTGVHAPSPAPAANVLPVVVVPLDGEAGNAASVIEAMEVPADYIAWLMQVTGGTRTAKAIIIDGAGGVSVSRTADSPLQWMTDTAGNVRSLFDHNGYPLGRRCEWRQEWRGIITNDMTTAPDTITAGGTSAYPATIANRAGGTANNTDYTIASNGLTHLGFTGISLVLEMDVSFDTITATNTALFAGLTNSTGLTGAVNLVGFERLSGGTNWKLVLSGSSSVDLGVTPSTSATLPQRLRLEVHGSASPYGSKVRAWVDDVLKGEISGAIWNNFARVVIGPSTGTSPSVATNTLCGSILMTWNRVLSLPLL